MIIVIQLQIKKKDINGIFYILTNMNEAHDAYFLNQGDSCLQQNTEKLVIPVEN